MTNATKSKRNYIDPLLELKILAMTQPNSPKSPTQKYYLTEAGRALLDGRIRDVKGQGSDMNEG